MFLRLFSWLVLVFRDGYTGGLLQIVFRSPDGSFTIGGIMNITLASGAVIYLGLQLDLDAGGNPTTLLPGPVTWSIDNPAAATMTPSDDGLTVTVVGTGLGAFNITADSGTLTAAATGTTTAGVTTGITIVQVAAPDTTTPVAPVVTPVEPAPAEPSVEPYVPPQGT